MREGYPPCLVGFICRTVFSRSALPETGGVLAVLHAVEGDVDNWNQALGGAQGTEQPIGVSLAENAQDVALVEAQLSGLGGDVVAQCSYFTEKSTQRQKVRISDRREECLASRPSNTTITL